MNKHLVIVLIAIAVVYCQEFEREHKTENATVRFFANSKVSSVSFVFEKGNGMPVSPDKSHAEIFRSLTGEKAPKLLSHHKPEFQDSKQAEVIGKRNIVCNKAWDYIEEFVKPIDYYNYLYSDYCRSSLTASPSMRARFVNQLTMVVEGHACSALQMRWYNNRWSTRAENCAAASSTGREKLIYSSYYMKEYHRPTLRVATRCESDECEYHRSIWDC